MLDLDGRSTQQKILLYLLGAVVLVLLFGVGMYRYFGSPGLTVADLTVSAILTAALVLLYFRQTNILESQRDLLTQELNREARQQHTETLRERVRIWHGNPDREIPDNPIDHSGMNLPTVGNASFNSAPTGSYTLASLDDKSFRVIPHNLEGDRYLQDLLKNHAPDLREKKDGIEQLYEQFDLLRDEFGKEFDEGIVHETKEYKFEPTDYFVQWLFEFLVAYERGKYEDFNEVRERALSQFRGGDTGQHPDEPRIWIRIDLGSESRAVYSAVTESSDRDEVREKQSVAKEKAEQLIEQIFDRVEAEQPYKQTEEAASVLDEAAEAVRDLEHLLVEYDGRPIYPGDCKYLKEAQISGD